jgi:O-antigen/teichoic acid export membrane protein
MAGPKAKPTHMSLTRAIAGNTFVQVSGKFIGTLLGILTVAVMTRHLGQAGYGEFTTAISFLQFFGILVDFGLTLTMIRMISDAGADESRVASNIFTLRLVSGLVFFGAAAGIAQLFPYPPNVKACIALGSLSFLGISLSSVLVGIFQKKLAVRLAAMAEVAGRLLLFLGVLFAARLGLSLFWVIGILVMSNLLQLMLSLVFAQKLMRIRPAFDLALWREIVRQSWPIGVSIAFNLVYLKGDVIVMSLYRTQSEVGLYGAAYKILDVITIIPAVFMGLVLPVLTQAWTAGDRESFDRRLGRAFNFLSFIALPLAVGTQAVAADLMSFVAGPAFAASGRMLSVLMLAGAMVFWSGLFGHAVVALGLQKKLIWAYGFDAAISLLLYLVLIPRYGATGAAWVTVFSETFIALATAAAVLYRTRKAVPLQMFGRALTASLIMYLALLPMHSVHVLWRVLAGMVIYAGLLWAFGGVTKEMIGQLRRPKVA